ncbi:hypothetical protein FGB62_1g32 [Gracilaria domingensis]|nr:hypothetical protein FGB62_1g32 [Gracilaria domingensis]
MPLRKQEPICDQSIWFQNDSSRGPSSKQAGFGGLFTETSWASDVFALFHSGLRHELKDLSNMIECSIYRKHRFEERELVAFEKWFVDFSYMVVMYFEAEANIVYPALLQMRPGLFSAMERQRARQTKVVKHLLEIHAECLMFTKSGKPSGTRNFAVDKFGMRRCVDRISRLANGLTDSLEQIFEWEVTVLTPVVKDCLMSWEASALVRHCLHAILEHKVGRQVVWGYFRDVPDKVKEQQLGDVEPVKRIRMRMKERRWTKAHRDVSKRFAVIIDTPRKKS